MAIPLRARRAPAISAGLRPAPLAPPRESVGPIVLLSVLTLVGFLLLAFIVYLVFSPGMAAPFG